jgi:hypothetical protein
MVMVMVMAMGGIRRLCYRIGGFCIIRKIGIKIIIIIKV